MKQSSTSNDVVDDSYYSVVTMTMHNAQEKKEIHNDDDKW